MVLILLQKGFYQALQEPKGKPCFPQRGLGDRAGLSHRRSPPACMGEAGPASTVFVRETRACAFYFLCCVSSPVLNILCVCFRNTLKHTLFTQIALSHQRRLGSRAAPLRARPHPHEHLRPECMLRKSQPPARTACRLRPPTAEHHDHFPSGNPLNSP